ncbi:hypothetical protein BH23ACT10_BH23ACT10_29220 [soil metagenome]
MTRLDDVPVDIDPTRDRPVYKQIADWLRDAITVQALRSEMRLPSESALMRRFRTTRTTVRRALSELENEGRVRKEQGVGVFVKRAIREDALIRQPYDRMARHRWREGMSPLYVDAQSRGFTPQDVAQDRVELAEVRPPREVADLLGVSGDVDVFRRRRRMWIGNKPTQLTASYIPLEIAKEELRGERTGDGGTHARIEELGYQLTAFVESLSARMPRPHESAELRLGKGVPVVDLTQTTYAGDQPVECYIAVIAADRYMFQYEINARPQPLDDAATT